MNNRFDAGIKALIKSSGSGSSPSTTPQSTPTSTSSVSQSASSTPHTSPVSTTSKPAGSSTASVPTNSMGGSSTCASASVWTSTVAVSVSLVQMASGGSILLPYSTQLAHPSHTSTLYLIWISNCSNLNSSQRTSLYCNPLVIWLYAFRYVYPNLASLLY